MKKAYAPWKPIPYRKADAAALQALATGTANEGQQKRALQYVIETAANTYDLAYQPNSPRDTDFALGRAFVGQQLVKLLKQPLSTIKDDA